MDSIQFIKKNFRSDALESKPLSLAEAENKLYEKLIIDDWIDCELHEKYKIFKHIPRELYESNSTDLKGRTLEQIWEEVHTYPIQNYKKFKNTNDLTSAIVKRRSLIEKKRSSLVISKDWRSEESDTWAWSIWNAYMLGERRASSYWLMELNSIRAKNYYSLAAYKYMFFYQAMMDSIGKEHLVREHLISPNSCKHFFKNHRYLHKFNLTRWSKSRKIPAGEQVPKDIKELILKDFLKTKEKFYDLPENTFFNEWNTLEQYRDVKFKTIFFDYMTLWERIEKNRLLEQLSNEFEKEAKEIKEKITINKEVDIFDVYRLLDIAKKPHQISELIRGRNFVLYLFDLINSQKKWSTIEKDIKKTNLSAYLIKEWFAHEKELKLFLPIKQKEEREVEISEREIMWFTRNLFLPMDPDENKDDNKEDMIDFYSHFHLHNAIEWHYKKWSLEKDNILFSEYLITVAEELSHKYLYERQPFKQK